MTIPSFVPVNDILYIRDTAVRKAVQCSSSLLYNATNCYGMMAIFVTVDLNK